MTPQLGRLALDNHMWLFIILTQLLALSTTGILWSYIRPNRLPRKMLLITLVFIISNAFLIYGLSEFWRERFRIYLIFSILQGFMIYAAVITLTLLMISQKILKRQFKVSAIKFARRLGPIIYLGIVCLAVFNSYSPVVKRLTVVTDKPLAQPLTIALVSDTHLGKWFGNRQIDNLVALVDDSQADVVVLAGDIMDDTTIYYDKTDMRSHLSKLKAPLGVYAVLGNHDYLGYEAAIAEAVKGAGITVLDNQSVLLDNAVWLVGRSDDLDTSRLTAQQLLTQVDSDKPIIFLEHRPSKIDEISALPIDLHLSGHTHGGQIFPLTILMDGFLPLNYGRKQVNGTEFLVSSGFGIGSVPFRLGTRSEIWIVTLQPK